MPRNVQELQQDSDRLIYEIWMFKGLSSEVNNNTESFEGVTTNAILESLLIHMRVLLDFFYKDISPRHPDDILAAKFFSSVENWQSIRERSKSDDTRHFQEDIHKHVAHLTDMRRDVNWDNDRLRVSQEINDLIEVFLRNVNQSYLGSRWDGFNSTTNNIDDFLPSFVTVNVQSSGSSFYIGECSYE